MVKRNPSFAKLHSQYLFPLMHQRKLKVMETQPNAKIISLGIGDTTEPLPKGNVEALKTAAEALGNQDTYSGYGPEQGEEELRQSIAQTLYQGMVDPDEVFIGDGSKCDIGRLQVLFGPNVKVAVQDPAYPVYVFTSVIMGQTGNWDSIQEQYENIQYLSCTPENNFFPDLENTPRADVVFFCSPNNPTGAVPTHEQLQDLVDWAKENKSIIVYDSAYSMYIRDESLPRSIFEIPGAREVALETGSFSKMMGYTGVRLGWTVVPEELCWDDGSPVKEDWKRVMSSYFNGASNLAQAGGLHALSADGMHEMQGLINYYMENARILSDALLKVETRPFGGQHSPFLWVPFPGKRSWDIFEELLEQAHVVVTPGSGFGPAGEGFVRLSAFGHRDDIEEAADRLVHSPLLQAT